MYKSIRSEPNNQPTPSNHMGNLDEKPRRSLRPVEILFFPVPFLAAMDGIRFQGRPVIFFYSIFLLWILFAEQPDRFLNIAKHRLFLILSVPFTVMYLYERSLTDFSLYFLQGTVSSSTFILLVTIVAKDRIGFDKVLWAFKLGGGFVALFLIYSLYGAVDVQVSSAGDISIIRQTTIANMSLDINPNNISVYVVLSGIIALYHLINSKSAYLLNLAVFLLSWLGISVVMSRSNIMALILSSLAIGIFSSRQNRQFQQLFIVLIIITIFSFLTLPSSFWVRFESISIDDSTNQDRVKLYSVIPTHLIENGLLGTQLHGYAAVAQELDLVWYGPNYRIVMLPHNVILTMVFVYGLGGLLWLITFFYFIYQSFKFCDEASPLTSPLAVGLLVQFIVFLLFSQALFLKYVGLTLGLLVSNEHIMRESNSVSHENL
jgi:hypothetical protein